MSGGASSSKSFVHKFDPQFRKIQTVATDILNQALGATLNQQQFQTALFSLLQPEFERLTKESELSDSLGTPEARAALLRQTIDRNSKLAEQASALNEQAAFAAKNLGTLTDSDRQLISGILSNARDIGQSQIDDFVSGNFRNANEIAASRGLRPTDAPIGNIRGRVAEEATTQKGLLESQLASQGSQLALDLPNQRLALLGQVAGQQTGLAQAGNQFQAALAQNATANRLNLAGTAGQLGLGLTGLANTGPGILGASRPAIGQKSSSAQGGISTRMLKINGEPVDAAEILERLQGLPIEAWEYLWDAGEDAFQIGPYAEDFQKAFGGESYKISFLHALGVSMVALQELAGRLDRLEEALGIGVAAERLPQGGFAA